MARGRNDTGDMPPVATAGRDDAPAAGAAGGRPRQTAGTGPTREGELWKAACFVFAAAAIVAGLAWALLGSSLLVVRSVQVTGVHMATRAEVLGAAGIRPGTPLIRINTSLVARRVERLIPIQSAQVSRDWPDKIVISVQERAPALAVPEPGGFGLIDEFGVIVRQVASKPPAMPLLTVQVPGPGAGSAAGLGPAAGLRAAAGPGSATGSGSAAGSAADLSPGSAAALRGSPAVRAAVSVLRELPGRLRHRVKSVSAPSATAITLQLTHGVTILWGGSDRSAAKVRELSILMRAHATYYDVSDPSVAVTGG